MALLSRKTKEAIKTVLVLAVIALIVGFYVVYPLIKTAAVMGRPEEEQFDIDSLPPNDPAAFVEAGFTEPDTFRVEADGLTSLAIMFLAPAIDSGDSVRGTALLLHEDGADRTQMIPLARQLTDAGVAVYLYDQRAAGLSSGRYRGDGTQEAADLLEVIGYLHIRERLNPPVTVIGYEMGADAALLAAAEEERINKVVAVSPYMSTGRYLDTIKATNEMISISFFRTVLWWWYGIRSGYVTTYRELGDLQGVACRTLLVHAAEAVEDDELVRIREQSDPARLTLMVRPDDEQVLFDAIVGYCVE